MLSKLQKVSKLRFGLLATPLVMGVVEFFASTFDKCFELSIYSNERQLLNCVFTFHCTKVIFFIDSAVAILPVSVRLIDQPVNRKFLVNWLTVNITNM